MLWKGNERELKGRQHHQQDPHHSNDDIRFEDVQILDPIDDGLRLVKLRNLSKLTTLKSLHVS